MDVGRLAELLAATGLNRNEAKVLAALYLHGKLLGKEIEKMADMRQPEVSVAAKELKRKGWVKERYVKKGRGSSTSSRKSSRN
jgi:predicted transcriptional regulator